MDTSVQLQNPFLHARINLHGAELVFLGNETTGNVLWSKQTDHWNRVAPNLFPIVGRLINDSYSFQGKSYKMTQHGFARDREFEIVEQSETEVRLHLISDIRSMDIYPYSFVFEVIYSITETDVTIAYKTWNTGNEPMYYSVGGHPAFYLEEALENYYLEFDSEIRLLRQELEGSYFSGLTTDYALSKFLNLSDQLFENDAFVLKNPGFKSVSLKHRNGKTLVQMNCDSWTAVGFWTKKDAPFICIEPWWGWADHTDSSGKLEEKSGIIQLEAGARESKVYHIEIPPFFPGL